MPPRSPAAAPCGPLSRRISMAQSHDESSPSRIELVVLACLSQKRPPRDAELGDAVQQLALPEESVEVARQRAVELLAGLVRRAWVTVDDEEPRRGRQRKTQSPRKLTDSGKRVLRNAFNLPRVPTWAEVRDKHLPSLALGVPPGSELAEKACTESAMMAAVLGARFGVCDVFTPMDVCDALIASALGMPGGRLTLGRIRAHVLLRGIDRQAGDAPSPDAKGYAAKLAAWIACSAVGVSGTQHKMARALARRWVCGEAHPLGVGSAAPAVGVSSPSTVVGVVPQQPPAGSAVPPARDGRPQPAEANGGPRVPLAVSPGEPTRSALSDARGMQPPAQNLLEVVRETIPRIGAEGRFGEKVYVSAIWRTIERDRKAGDLSLDHFKRWLVRANRDGWLVLARADLIGAMDARQVNESEINDRGATFHFVLDQRNGASASQRESHAG
ncbi:MAG TPA: hypothetical protein VF469_34965 [Kofleriaceae bacterium]